MKRRCVTNMRPSFKNDVLNYEKLELRERSLFRAPGGPRKKQGGSRTFYFSGGEGHELFGSSTVRVMNI